VNCTLQALEAALAEQRRTVSQLRAAAAAADGEHQAALGGLLAELAEKSSQLVDAERRCSQLVALMGRIASQTGGVQANGVMRQQQQYQPQQMERPGSAQGAVSGGSAAAAGRLAGQQQQHSAGGGMGLGLAGMKQQQQQWEQQQPGLLSSLRGSRDQQQGIAAGWGVGDGSALGSAGGYRGHTSGAGSGY
jgi:hypothetical protein